MNPKATTSTSLPATAIDYSDTLKYHPHDILILSYFPHEDLNLFHGRANFHRRLYRLCLELQGGGDPPQDGPLPPLPLRGPGELEPDVESWRKSALRVVDNRIALYSWPGVPAM